MATEIVKITIGTIIVIPIVIINFFIAFNSGNIFVVSCIIYALEIEISVILIGLFIFIRFIGEKIYEFF
jgi:hypothetical protein